MNDTLLISMQKALLSWLYTAVLGSALLVILLLVIGYASDATVDAPISMVLQVWLLLTLHTAFYSAPAIVVLFFVFQYTGKLSVVKDRLFILLLACYLTTTAIYFLIGMLYKSFPPTFWVVPYFVANTVNVLLFELYIFRRRNKEHTEDNI